MGYVFSNQFDLRTYNNGKIEVVDIQRPAGFKPGKLRKP